MCNFKNIQRFLHFSIALDMSRITHFMAELTSPKILLAETSKLFPCLCIIKLDFHIFYNKHIFGFELPTDHFYQLNLDVRQDFAKNNSLFQARPFGHFYKRVGNTLSPSSSLQIPNCPNVKRLSLPPTWTSSETLT